MNAHNASPLSGSLVGNLDAQITNDDWSDALTPPWAAELPLIQQLHWAELESRRLDFEDTVRMIRIEEDLPGTPAEWSELMQRMRLVYVSRRNASDVAKEHALSVRQLYAELAGKRVLNVGVGNSTLASDLRNAEIPVELTSVDTDHRVLRNQPGRTVRASAEALPFTDGSFDVVLMTCSLPLWAASPEQAIKALDEGLRVLALDGVLMISPIAQAFSRVLLDKHGDDPIDEFEGESDPRFRMVLYAIDLATIQWLETVAQDQRFEVTLESVPRNDIDLDRVMSVTIKRVG